LSIYVLSGFCSLGTFGPSFLIPYFILRGTNRVFAQELDANFLISEFRSFAPENYDPVYFVPTPVPREIGQIGLTAYISNDGAVIFDDADKLRATLANRINESAFLSQNSCTFFNLEVSLFVGNSVATKSAIAGTSVQFSNIKNSGLWQRVASKVYTPVENELADAKISSLRVKAVSEIDLTRQIDLLQDLTSEEWQSRWFRLWYKTKDRQELTRIAISWLKIQPLESVELPVVLLTTLNSSREDLFLRELTAQWLGLNQFNLIYWGRLWLLLNTRSLSIDKIKFMEDEGFEFLEATIDLTDRKSVETWSLVWNRLRRRRKLSKRLVQLAERASPKYGDHTRFVQLVLPHIASEPFARQRLIGWLKNSPQKSVSWPDIYVRLLNQNESHDEILSMGINWLRSNPNLNRWKKVWDVLRSRAGNHDELIQIARSWLEKAYPDIHVWPEVMAAVIEASNFDETEIDIAERWLISHPDRKQTKSFRRLEELVRVAKSPKKITAHNAMLVMRRRLETEIIVYARRFKLPGVRKNNSIQEILNMLREQRAFSPTTIQIIDDLVKIGNTAAHQGSNTVFDDEDVTRYGDLLDFVIRDLEQSTIKKSL
jgi:hypothetical protein